ncbi:MAG: hypothetical protein LBS09_08005 [Bacteroidales bacterium]|jgi:hypothetical protein|nr:hypothetical protein [Bacteroidales bacterium]
MKSNISILIAALALTAVSCRENDIVFNTEEMDYRPVEFAAPVAKVHVPIYKSMEKWLDIDGLFVNNEGVICTQYTYSESIGWNSDIGIDDISGNWNIALPSTPVNISTPPITDTISIKPSMNENNQTYVESAKLTAGTIRFSVELPSGYEGRLTIKIPELTRNNNRFSINFDALSSGTNTLTSNLAGYTITTAAPDHNLNFAYEVQLTAGSGSASGPMTVTYNISNIEVDYLSGYFGQQSEQSESDDFTFDVFESLDMTGEVGFKDITIQADVTSNIGVPFHISAPNGIEMYKDNTLVADALQLSSKFEFNLPAASRNAGTGVVTPGTCKYESNASMEFDNGLYPNRIRLNVTGNSNPDGEGPTPNFIVKTNNDDLINIDLTLTVPLHFKTEAYNRQDTVDFDFNDLIDDDEELSKSIENVTIHLAVDNGLPFNISLSATAIDDAGLPVETIMDNERITNSDQTQNVTISLNQSQIQKFRTQDVKHVILSTSASTSSGTYVKVYEHNALDIAVSLRFKSDIPSNIFE